MEHTASLGHRHEPISAAVCGMTCRSWVGQVLLLSVLAHLVVVSGQNDNADGEHPSLTVPSDLSDICNLSGCPPRAAPQQLCPACNPVKYDDSQLLVC